MPTFFERVRTALAREGYEVVGDRELGSGGMGIVVRARHVGLDHLVAVKVIRPEVHTADAVTRFTREAQILAKLAHPNIVRVLTSGATRVEQLPFYVMEYLPGQTLADRLVQGPLTRREGIALAHGLLDALAHAHAHGVVHRDVKPANVFWDGQKAILVDFGIAKRTPSSTTPSSSATQTGAVRGTVEYMALEQRAGAEATPASDQYSAALVIFEAFTGRHWFDAVRSQKHLWRGVPWFVRPALERALADEPAARWPDVPRFRRMVRIWPPLWKQLAAAAIVILTVGAILPSHGLELTVSTLSDRCGGAAGRRVQDSLVEALQGNPDFSTERTTFWSLIERGPTMRARGSACVRNDSLTVRLTLALPQVSPNPSVVTRGDTAHVGAVAESLALGIVREIWKRENPLDSILPIAALPHNAQSLAGLIVAERLFAQARWGEADSAYRAASTLDSTCWLCDWRLAEVDKWVGLPFDSIRYQRVLRHLSAFPATYRTVIRLARTPLRTLLDSLQPIAQRRQPFVAARFLYADEMYHRGPLIGYTQRDAIQAFQDVLNARPDFLPAIEHLAWVSAAAGEEREARRRLDRLPLDAAALRDPYVRQIRVLLKVGITCRFASDAVCDAVIDTVMRGADPVKYPDLAAGPRYLMTFDAPRAAAALGKRFAALTQARGLAESGFVAELSGYLALGMPDSARAAAQSLRALGHAELLVLPAELDGALVLLDPQPGEAATRWPAISRDLITHAHSAAGTPDTRRRAAWMLLLLARRGGVLPDSTHYLQLLAGESGRHPLLTLLEADRRARQGDLAQALRSSDPLTPLQADSLGKPESADPFFRTVLHLLRAGWYERRHDPDAALRELQWANNNDDLRANGPPQVSDIDWAFGTLARWEQARLLDTMKDDRRCELYRDVIRSWSGGEPRYRARADSAAARVAALSCAAAP